MSVRQEKETARYLAKIAELAAAARAAIECLEAITFESEYRRGARLNVYEDDVDLNDPETGSVASVLAQLYTAIGE